MPHKRNILFITLVIALLGAAIAVIEYARRTSPEALPSTSTTSGATPFPREVRDGGGEILRLARPPQKIVSQTLATDEILLAITAPERIAALSSVALQPQYSNIVEQAQALGLPTIKDAEGIIALKPDLIFISSYSKAETVELLRATGAPVFRFASFDRIADVEKNILLVGRATGDDARAAEVVAGMRRDIEAIKRRVPSGARPPRVLSFNLSGDTAGAETLFDDALAQIGAVNVAAEQGLKGFPRISAEQVAAWQPDVIVTGAAGGQAAEKRRQLLANPVIAATRAGREGKIVVIDSRYFLTVSHHVVRLLEVLADALYQNQQA